MTEKLHSNSDIFLPENILSEKTNPVIQSIILVHRFILFPTQLIDWKKQIRCSELFKEVIGWNTRPIPVVYNS